MKIIARSCNVLRLVVLLTVFLLHQVRLLVDAHTNTYTTTQKSMQSLLNKIISDSLSMNSFFIPPTSTKGHYISHNQSSLRSICSTLHKSDSNRKRVGCCQPDKMKILYNVQLNNGQFTLLYNATNETSFQLPQLFALRMQRFMPVQEIDTVVRPRRSDKHTKCKTFFNGTLHITGDRTYHKLYHAVGDNYAPAVSQILLDAYLDEPYLFLPRMKLHIDTSGAGEISPYMNLLNNLFSAGTKSVQELNGWCFRRVMWGPGPYVFYNDQRVALRRMVADFARLHVNTIWSMAAAVPAEYTASSPVYPAFSKIYKSSQPNQPNKKHISKFKPKIKPQMRSSSSSENVLPKKQSNNRNRNHQPAASTIFPPSWLTPTDFLKRRQLQLSDSINYVWNSTINKKSSLKRNKSDRTPLKIVLYSRGNEGTRSLKLESNLMTAIADSFGAYTAICCDYEKVTVEQQISYAYHADVIIGLHGAALVHGIFSRKGLIMVEFKTRYAYTSLLFPLVTDSRSGTHAVLDTRDYFYVRGQKPLPNGKMPDGVVDQKLIDRTVAVLDYSLKKISKSTSREINRNDPVLYPRDFIFNTIQLHEDRPRISSSHKFQELGHILGPFVSTNITHNCQKMIISRARNEIFLSLKLKGEKTGSDESSNKLHCPVCYAD